MKYLCVVYVDEEKLNALSESESEALDAEALAYDEALRKSGHYIVSNALQSVNTATTIRLRKGEAVATDGPFAETKEQLGGILLLEAKDLNHAIQLMSQHPGVRLGGPFEIRPAAEEINELVAARDRASQR